MDSEVAQRLFERRLKFRERIAFRRAQRGKDAEFIFQHAALSLADKLADVNREFSHLLAIAPRDKALLEALLKSSALERISRLTFWEPSPTLARALSSRISRLPLPPARLKTLRVRCHLPPSPAAFDGLLSLFSLHWYPSIPDALRVLTPLLKADSPLFLAAFGEGTLSALHRTLLSAESRLHSHIPLRVHTLPSTSEAGDALRDFPLALPLVESTEVCACYLSLRPLLHDLQSMGESACLEDTTPLSRSALSLAERLYPREQGRLQAMFHVLYLHGWTPDPSQPQALVPGSARASLADALTRKG